VNRPTLSGSSAAYAQGMGPESGFMPSEPSVVIASLGLPFPLRVETVASPWPALGPCWRDLDRRGRQYDGRVLVHIDGRKFYGYRLVALAANGLGLDGAPGLVAAHLCDRPWCVNGVEHVRFMPPGENTRRGAAPSVVASRTGLCAQGHDDWALRPGDPSRRYCRACSRERDRRRAPRRKKAA